MELLSLKNKYRNELDGLRAFAILAVVINHLNKNILPNGFLGVDIFFVISGYVITSSLIRNKSNSLKCFLSKFYEKRIKRLLPALCINLFFIGLICFLIYPDPRYYLRTGISSLFGASNLYLFKHSVNYFAPNSQLNPFMQTWSLGVEFQFYLIYPILFWFSAKSKIKTKYSSKNLFFSLIFLFIFSLIFFLSTYNSNNHLAYFLMPSRLWEIVTGCLLCFGFNRQNKLVNQILKIPPLIILCLLFGFLLIPFPSVSILTIIIVFLSALLIKTLKEGSFVYKFFTNKYIVYIGLISYSLYLWHWGIISISRWTIGITWWTIPFQIVLIFLISIISYEFIENLFRLKKSIKFSRVLLLFIYIFFVIVFAFETALSKFLFSGQYKYRNLITRSRNSQNIYNGLKCNFLKNSNLDSNFNFKNCFIRKNNASTIYFLGNSHTDHLRETQYRISEKLNISIDGISVELCIFPPSKLQKSCGNVQEKLLKRVIDNVLPNDIVVISNRHYQNYKRDNYNWFENQDSIQDLEIFAEKMNIKGVSVVVFAPTPEFVTHINQCTKEWFRIRSKECFITKHAFRLKNKGTYKLLNSLSQNILVYDPLDAICPNKLCSMTDHYDRPLYNDRDHFTDFANKEYIFEDFVIFLKRNKLIKKI